MHSYFKINDITGVAPMVKSELIQRIADKQSGLQAKDVETSVNHIIDMMSDSLANGKRIEIRGFGSISIRHRPARVTRNPRTGAHVNTPAKFTPHFKPGKDLRDRVNNSRQHCQIKSLKED